MHARAPLPSNEIRRLDALRGLGVLDTPPEKAFDDLVTLAAWICEARMAAVSLVDADRQWFKARHGLDVAETSRDVSFCAHTILDGDPLVVEDTVEDPRFAENPLVIQQPSLRFYAGAPLCIEDDLRLGSLCVLDVQPHRLTTEQLEALCVLRDAVVARLELRRLTNGTGESTLTMCAWCKSVRDEESEDWVRIDLRLQQLHPVSHGICPRCLDQFGSA